MTKNILYILLLLCSCIPILAQNNAIFSGGNADGFNRDCYQQQIPATIDFGGGNNDGYAKGCYLQTIPLTVDFGGGNNDGYAKDCYQQLIPLTVDFGGGNNDGYAKDCYTQVTPLTVDFGGGNNDGYAKDCFTQQSNLNAIYNGGNGGDGMLNGCANEPLGCFLTINLGNDTTFCSGNNLTLDAGTFPGGATYIWQDNSTAQTFTVNTTGTYYVLVTDTGGCTGTDSIQITVNPVPSVNLGNDTSFCVGSNLVLNAQNTGATYQWQNGNTAPFLNQTFTAASTGQYFVKVSFGLCSDSDTINIIVHPISTTNLANPSICQGDSALIFGGYKKVAGTYRDTIMASTGCDSILVKQLIVNPVYNQTLATITICNGDSALIFGDYEKVAATYTSSLQSVNGCDSIVTQTLNVSPSHFVNLGNDTSFCAGNSITLDAGAGANSYRWQNGTTTQFRLQTFIVNATGTYYVETVLGACTTRDTINITVNPNRTTNLVDSVICQGDSALIFGNYESVAGNYYNTLNTHLGCDSVLVQQLIVKPVYNQTLATVNICAGDSALIFGNYETIAGIYSVNLQSINGCDSIVSQTLGVLSNSSVNLGNDTTICAGQNVLLNAGSATSYQWQNNSTNQTFNATAAGQYYVNVTTGGCSASDTINITVNPNKTTNLPDSVICHGDSALIFGSYETVAGNYYNTLSTYLGCDSVLVQQLIVNPVYNQTLATINICLRDSALIFGNYETVADTYTDTLQSINGCDSIVSQTLNVDTAPVVALGNDTTFCSGNSLTLDAGTGATSYQWQNGNTNPFQNQTFIANTSGVYFVTATIGVCSTTDSIEVTVIQPVFTTNLVLNSCNDDSVLIFGNYENTSGLYYDTLQSSITSCDSIIVQELIVSPNVMTNDTIVICTGESVFVGGALQTTAGTYYDTLQTNLSCDSIIVTELEVVNGFVLNTADTICEGESLFVGGALQTVSGLYNDTLQSLGGCDSVVITDLLVNPKPVVVVTAEPNFIMEGQSSQLTATGGGTYIWTPVENLSCGTCSSPIVKPTKTTTYSVTVESNGCLTSDTVSVTLDDEFMIPDGFSPNGDGVNDVFEIVGLSNYTDAQITIFNRWGAKVFEASPYKGDWNGTNQFGLSIGDKLPSGTYFYILDLGKESPERAREIKGYIYLNN
jgi:gliding motility-associated-like protein